MRGSVAQKLGRIIRDVATNPSGAARYIANCRAKPLKTELPWFSWGAIDYLRDTITKKMTVFEYGSGGSTFFFSARASTVTSVEDHLGWFDLIQEALTERRVNNVDYSFASSKGGNPSPFLLALDRPFDVIVVDGSEDWPSEIVRPEFFKHAETYVKPGGIIVVDDAWRYDGMITRSQAKQHTKFESVGPGRFGVTRTDIYQY